MFRNYLFLPTLLGMLFCCPEVLAQTSQSSAWGELFAGGGLRTDGDFTDSLLHVGGGGEVLVNGGLGIRGEIGFGGPFEDFDEGLGMFSAGVSYTFNREETMSPFLTGGYTLFFRSGATSGVNFGGGVNYWLGEHFGLRFEARDQVMVEHNLHFLEGRFSVLIR